MILFVLLTAMQQLVPLPGVIAHFVFMAGTVLGMPFGLSLLISFAMLFSWRHYHHFYLPFLISALTFVFLYFTWMVWTPTHTSTMNGDRDMFYYHTGVELPGAITDVKDFDDIGGFPADGDAELSFHMNASDMQKWMLSSGLKWKSGPHDKSGDVLNTFTDNGSLTFKDSADIEYVTIERESPSNVTTIFVNQKEGWVLVRDHDI